MNSLCTLFHSVHQKGFAVKGLCTLAALLGMLALPVTSSSQVVITQEEFTSIFTPGTSIFINQNGGTFDIGTPGGPQIFDFSSFSLVNPDSSNCYSVGTIPALAARYPAEAVTLGQSLESIENNPVSLSRNDTVFSLGQASVTPSYRFVHYRPYEIVAKFPTVYGATVAQFLERLDTTYNGNWQVTATDYSTSNEITTIDGYGTLRLATGDYPCLRIRKDHTGYGDKEFVYLTKEGLFADVLGVSATSPDSGEVSGFLMVLRKGSLVGVTEIQQQPRTFTLQQNYPNPFNPSTQIAFSVAQEEQTTLKVYNLLGQEVASLVSGIIPAGDYTVPFDGSNMASGVYFYRLASGSHVLTQRMILMK